jgi:hypothetical protein
MRKPCRPILIAKSLSVWCFDLRLMSSPTRGSVDMATDITQHEVERFERIGFSGKASRLA